MYFVNNPVSGEKASIVQGHGEAPEDAVLTLAHGAARVALVLECLRQQGWKIEAPE